LQTIIILFNLFVFIISFRENKTALENCEANIKNTEELIHQKVVK